MAGGARQDLQMFVRVYRYPAESPWNKTDMIGIPVSMWRRLYAEEGRSATGADRPVFVWLGLGNVVGRVQPDADLDWEPGRVEVPEWMWLALGAPDTGAPMEMDVTELHDVGRIVLRPRSTQAAEAGEAILTAELSSGRWATLQCGMELSLDCGVFDVLNVTDVVGSDVLAGCILNQDVTVEFVPRPGTPPPSPPAMLLPSVEVPVPAPAPVGGAGMSFPGMQTVTTQTGSRSGFIPFSGTGNRLGSS